MRHTVLKGRGIRRLENQGHAGREGAGGQVHPLWRRKPGWPELKAGG